MGNDNSVETTQAVEATGQLARKCGAAPVTNHSTMESSRLPSPLMKEGWSLTVQKTEIDSCKVGMVITWLPHSSVTYATFEI
jgi:hypothetical protein